MTRNDRFKNISTGNGYAANLNATTNNRLELAIEAIEEVGSNISALEETIIKLNESNTRLQRVMVALATIGAASAVISLFDLVTKYFS